MGDTNKKYLSFWRRHMHRSVSSPSLARKSGKISKDEISIPYPGDPSGFGPLNSFHGTSQSNSTNFRSAEILSKSQSNVRELKHEKVQRDFCGDTRSKSISHLLKSQEIYNQEHHNTPQSRKCLGSGSSETPSNLETVPTDCPDVASFEIGKTDSKAYNDSSTNSEVDFTSCNGVCGPNMNNKIDTLVNSTQVASLQSVNREESKGPRVRSIGKQSKNQTKIIQSTKEDEKNKKQEKKVKHNKRMIFGISFRRKKKENTPIDKKKGNGKLYEVSEEVLLENASSEASSSCINSGKPQENILLKDKCDDLFDYGSPVYEIMTPTEIYERRASIRNLNGASTPKLPNNQQKVIEKEERYFDFDVDKINMKIHQDTRNNEQSHKTCDAESRIIGTPEVNKMLETNHNMSNIKVDSDSHEVNCLTELSPTISESLNKSAMISSASDTKKHPDSLRKHQNVTRSRSEPTKAREDLRIHKSLTHTQSEAFSPILNDHLLKHNKKVAAELGIDIPSLRKLDIPAIGAVGDSNDTIGGAAKYSISTKVVKRRPVSLTLPEHSKALEQTSPHSTISQNNSDRNPKPIPLSLTSDSVTHKTKISTSSNDLSLPGIQNPNTSTKNQFVVQNSGYQKRDTLNDTRPLDNPLLDSQGRATDSTDGSTAKHYIDKHEKTKKNNNSIPAAPPPIIVGAIKKRQQDHTKRSDHDGMNKDSLNTKIEHLLNNEVHNVPFQYDIPISREATLHPHLDDVFDTSTHPIESSISQKNKFLAREDLYDIPQCHSTQPVTSQRSDRTPSGNVYDIPNKHKPPISKRPPTRPSSSERDVAKAAVVNWVTNRLAQLPPNAQAMYVNQHWLCKVQPKVLYHQPPIYEENSERIYQAYKPREFKTVKANNYRDPYDYMSLHRSASLERLRPQPVVNSVAFGNVHSPIPHYIVPRKLHYPQPAFYYPPAYVAYHRHNVTDQYVPFARSASLDRLGRRPQVQSSVNLYSRSNDVPHRQIQSPPRYKSQPANPTGFYRTASLDRLGRRPFVRPPLPRDRYSQTPRLHNTYQNYYHQPPLYMNNHQSASLDRRSRDAARGRTWAYSAAQAMKPPPSPQYEASSQMQDFQRNYHQPTTI
ncbi:uncharacterized protein [Palaemon carinicauda]|uniref:uncharacterized protein n=1 Tax=Palaemon carinicauda TaxID=392227 RepID=UPI0035B587FC